MKLVLLVALSLASAAPLCAQSRVEQYASAFTKKKDVTKTKYGVSVRKFYQVRAEPWLPRSAQMYTGGYDSDVLTLNIDVAPNGVVTGTGMDAERGRFELRNARIAKGMLTGTEVYASGRRGRIEAAFLRRYDVVEPGGSEMMMTGLGFLVDPPRNAGFTGTMKLFLVKQAQ